MLNQTRALWGIARESILQGPGIRPHNARTRARAAATQLDVASDDRIEYMNAHALPRGCGPLLVAELVARELDSFVRELVYIPRIVRRVQLPAFEYDIHAPYAWPRSSSVDAGSLMFRAICELGSRSA